MSDALKVTYNGVEITYVEDENVWQFELRCRERSAESLQKAKQTIDAPLPKDKKPFRRMKAWTERFNYKDGWFLVDVTSIAESRYTPKLWISLDGHREKVVLSELQAASNTNNERVQEIKGLKVQIVALNKQVEAIKAQMEAFALPKDTEGAAA